MASASASPLIAKVAAAPRECSRPVNRAARPTNSRMGSAGSSSFPMP